MTGKIRIAQLKQWLWQLPWSTVLFWATIALFLAETSWVAFRSAFPMAYDESFHVGLIQIFTEHLNPIISQQHPSTFGFGNIVHNPSWLYHWLLSFPDRLLSLGSLRTEVVGLTLYQHRIWRDQSLRYTPDTQAIWPEQRPPYIHRLSRCIDADICHTVVSG